ncbi:MAG: carboxylesterase family protein [Myxococcales bacterium]|nr:carboxylesterase family protein [Myxococcales bacterium]
MNARWTMVAIAALGACSPPVNPPNDAADSATMSDATSNDGAPEDVTSSDGGSCVVAPSTDPAIVATDKGRIRGTVDTDVRVFLGIPYAEPPVGARRFRAPVEHACWSDDRDATRFGAICPQVDDDGNPVGNEDCLTLNVYAPTAPPATPLPVLFFIHGGGNNQGSAQVLAAATQGRGFYDGRSLARRGAVVVTIQYRLGALGFLSHEALDRESATEPSGAQGIRDQILALRWVQRNIRQFGGDPSKVMVFGESAGGLDTMLLVTSPRAAGLFSSALSQSGGLVANTQAVARAAAQRLVMAASCASAPDALACLRAKTPAELIMALPPSVTGLTNSDFVPSIDGDVLPENPSERIRAGRHNQVPIVYGTNSEETSRMVPPAAMVQTQADFERFARPYLAQYAISPTQINAALTLYAPSNFASPHEALVALTTDTRWTCPARANLRAVVMGQRVPAYRYFFTHRHDARLAPMLSAFGAYHGIELGYVFGTVDGLLGYRPTAADRAVIDAVQTSWIRFAATGSLATGSPMWPAYDAATDPYLELSSTPAARTNVRGDRCDGLARIVMGG